MRQWTADAVALLLRLAAGLIFIPHGYSKIFGSGGVAAFARDLPSYGIPSFLGYAAAYAEFYGAILLLAGLLTRFDAFLLACTMLVAIFVVQLPDALRDPEGAGHRYFASMHLIELPLALMVIALALMLTGGGRLSLDALLGVDRLFGKKKTAAGAAVS